jgi:hypothetical protein
MDMTVLRDWPATEGLLLERIGGEPNYAFHGLALLAMRALHVQHSAGSEAVIEAIQAVKGKKLSPTTINRQDNSLQGWSWMADTFSWVEPTAWCLLALKQWRRVGSEIDSARIDIAERLLIDRCCREGGWNYGNSNMLGQQLKPFVPTTAIALLSLQDRKTLPEVQKSVDYLERSATEERSGSALALAGMALQAYERPTDRVTTALIAQVPITIDFTNCVAAAIALCFMDNERTRAAFVF